MTILTLHGDHATIAENARVMTRSETIARRVAEMLANPEAPIDPFIALVLVHEDALAGGKKGDELHAAFTTDWVSVIDFSDSVAFAGNELPQTLREALRNRRLQCGAVIDWEDAGWIIISVDFLFEDLKEILRRTIEPCRDPTRS